MKTIRKVFVLILVLGSVMIIASPKAVAQGATVSFQVFYDELSPYGYWVSNPDYGYVWVPNVASGFTPYSTNGYWVFTDLGWTWVSAYPWGWAPFHYGRWHTDAHYGHVWVPGNEWGPGWVTWRRSGGYYGWAPIGPGVSISVAYSSGYHVPHNHWRFVRDRDFGRPDIHKYYVSSSNNVTIINNSTIINNTRIDKTRNVTYNGGPDRAEVEKKSGRKYNPVTIKESNKPGEKMNKNELQVYRPRVENGNANGKKPAPAKVTNMNDTKAPSKLRETTNHKTKQAGKQQAKEQKPAQPGNRKSNQQSAKKQPYNISQPKQNNESNHKQESQSKNDNPKKMNYEKYPH